jgi:cytochrome P450
MAQAELLQRAPMSIDVSDPRLYQDDTWRPLVARLRRDDAVHYCSASPFARNDVEFAGRKISRGDKVVMWYISRNRDEEKIDRADEFIIDRAKPRQHLSFGAGIHRCVGDRLAEQQLRILWEEILQRNFRFEIVGAPQRLYSNFIRGIRALPVRIVSWQPK